MDSRLIISCVALSPLLSCLSRARRRADALPPHLQPLFHFFDILIRACCAPHNGASPLSPSLGRGACRRRARSSRSKLTLFPSSRSSSTSPSTFTCIFPLSPSLQSWTRQGRSTAKELALRRAERSFTTAPRLFARTTTDDQFRPCAAACPLREAGEVEVTVSLMPLRGASIVVHQVRRRGSLKAARLRTQRVEKSQVVPVVLDSFVGRQGVPLSLLLRLRRVLLSPSLFALALLLSLVLLACCCFVPSI